RFFFIPVSERVELNNPFRTIQQRFLSKKSETPECEKICAPFKDLERMYSTVMSMINMGVIKKMNITVSSWIWELVFSFLQKNYGYKFPEKRMSAIFEFGLNNLILMRTLYFLFFSEFAQNYQNEKGEIIITTEKLLDVEPF